MTVLIYVDTRKQVGDRDHLKVFDSQAAAQAWFDQHSPEGVAFEYEVNSMMSAREAVDRYCVSHLNMHYYDRLLDLVVVLE